MENTYSIEDAVEFYKERHISSESSELAGNGQLVIPKTILNNQVCGHCLNYLSVGPVTVYKDRQVRCGRTSCVKDQTMLQSSSQSMYNTIVEKCLFNCVNQYDGCRVDLPYSEENIKHESVCRYNKTYKCFHCNFLGNGCQFVYHYKRIHSELVANAGVFSLDTNCDVNKILLFPTTDQLFRIHVELNNVHLKISCRQLNSSSPIKSYSVVMFEPCLGFEYVSKKATIKSGNVTIDLHKIQTFFKSTSLFGAIKLHKKHLVLQSLPNRIDNDSHSTQLTHLLNLFFRTELVCCNCNNLIKDKKSISFCPQIHITCSDCLFTECKVCRIKCYWLNIKNLVAENKVFCDWTNCNREISCLYFENHKQICTDREYHCPITECEFLGINKEFLTHWEHLHRSLPLIFGRTLDFSVDEYTNKVWIIDYLNEMLIVKIRRDGKYAYVEVDEKHAIFPYNYKLELMYCNKNYQHFEKWGFLIQKGTTKVFPSSCHGYDRYRLVVTINENFVINDPLKTAIKNKTSSESVLKQMITMFFKASIKCCNCNNLISDKSEVYFCSQSHILCIHCIALCKRCGSDNVNITSLKKITGYLNFSCDWPGCTQKTNWWNFLSHKQTCPKKLYVFNGFVGTKDELIIRWPSQWSELKTGSHLDFKVVSEYTDQYWLSDNVNELLLVVIYGNKKNSQLEVDEKYAVFPTSYVLKLYKYNPSKRQYEHIEELKQIGNKKICSGPVHVDKEYRLTVEKK